jgi:hypothetical protein
MERWLEILRTRTEHGTIQGLDRPFMERVMKLLHQESIRIQTEVMNTLRTNGECGSEKKGDKRDNNIDRNYPWDTSDTED